MKHLEPPYAWGIRRKYATGYVKWDVTPQRRRSVARMIARNRNGVDRDDVRNSVFKVRLVVQKR